ncbi:hypothetical protein J2W49_001897 [Hydrogenophaga palleronii]|uniref:Uncharacterized protein n=1 Tax=Hydrogenophaga palleronii TaxID=65655 RepID=A0ABU1WLZ1_9BURK|nr:hypothetical protein [Hydrogenophaga palleronii]MDR7149942.1 hypothetical protein [Hydrogenophaga palleronii]
MKVHPTQAAQAAAEVRRHDEHLHARSSGKTGSGQRGQFGGYVFRVSRASAPRSARRPPRLRRPPRPPGAQQVDLEHIAEQGPTTNMRLAPQSSALEDEERSDSLVIDAMAWNDDAHDGMQEQDHRQKARALSWRVGRRKQLDGDVALLSGLQAVCGADAQALWSAAGANTPVRAEDLARALVHAMVDVHTAAERSSPMPDATNLQLAAVRMYLMKVLQSGLEQGPLATLWRVKRALLESRPKGPRRPPTGVGDEDRQNRNLLLPLKLLNADRPRSAEQVQQACDRMALSWQMALMGASKPTV